MFQARGNPAYDRGAFEKADRVSREDNDNDLKLEYSPLCGNITRDGLTVRVQIYRIAGRGDGWSLEVVDHTDASTVWGETFATDRDAYGEFFKTLETEGIRLFSEEATGRLN